MQPAPIFAKNFPDGNAKKKQRFVLDTVLCVSSIDCFRCCYALALAHAAFAFCVYVFRIGDGYRVTVDRSDFLED